MYEGEKKVQAVAKTMPEGNHTIQFSSFLSYLEDWRTSQSFYIFKNLLQILIPTVFLRSIPCIGSPILWQNGDK